ncbi:enoyl-CoA hydratase/isomerase family protein [Nocardioides seonyuensis]|uniref:Enoyl-CoA hydratase/isomerase family protein n=2 Tax=Nocardioides seonyuensis TaxID=2518371 RepID=A0A4P7IKZ2_9ACTN|nr:enoyl-CoA hydratase/isomerase family protein [Nocardioides seonyuensis]
MMSAMTSPDLASVGLRFEVDGPVATLTLDRPSVRNAQTPAMWQAMAELGRSIPDEVRVVVLTGAGDTFSAGLDRAMLDPSTPDGVAARVALGDAELADWIGGLQEGFTWLRDPRFVSIAGVRGYAIGAGFQLALSCDLRVVADDVRFSMKESALGLVPDLTGTKPLVEHVGYARALEICATARFVEAEEALAIGLANSVVPADGLDAAVAELASALCAPMPGVVPATKALLQGADSRSLDDQCRLEREAQVQRFRALVAAFAG